MQVTPRQLNRATLDRQSLLAREPLDVVEAVRRIVALQAQEPASPYLALWNRVAGFDPAELDRAFADHAIVKATLMRITLHAVAAPDYPVFHEAMQRTLRAARLGDRRFTSTGLAAADADGWVPEVLAFAERPRTNAQVQGWLSERLDERAGKWLWWALRQAGPFVHHPTGGPWSFGPRPSYVAARELLRSGDPVAALQGLVRRYLAGFGPASAADIGQFGLLYRPPLREAIDGMPDLVRLQGPAGADLLDLPERSLPPEDSPAPPRLLGMWDSIHLAYADRSRIIPPDYRKLVIRTNGDCLPTILVDGYVAGVWRPVDGGGIEATAFHPLSDDAWAGLEAEATALLGFLADREPAVYRRYARWWTTLPGVEVRRLGG